MATNKQQVAKTGEATPPVAVSNQLPAYMQDKQGQGTDNLSTKDMEVPRLKLMAAISPEVTEHNDAKPGEFWHTLAEQSLGKEMLIVPVYIDKRYVLWRPRKSGGGILARADDGIHWNPPNVEFDVILPETKKTVKWHTRKTVEESGLDQWGTYDPADPNSQPAATLVYTFIVAMPDYPDLGFAQLNLQRGSVKVARSLIGKIKINKAPSYGRVFRMKSTEEQTADGPFYNFAFTAEGYVQDQDAFNAYESLYNTFSKTGLNIKDLDSLQEDGSVGRGGEAPPSQTGKKAY